MKSLMIVVALLGATATASAFAQTNSATQQASQPLTQVALNSSSATSQAGQWVPPSALPGKTRAQVYHELVQAEQDGQLAYLNSTIYAHS
jgi:polygalacturonase